MYYYLRRSYRAFNDEVLAIPGRAIGAAGLLFLFLIGLVDISPYLKNTLILATIFALFAASWDLLFFSGQLNLGQFDPKKIEVIGAKVAEVKKPYRMHPDIDRELQWQGPMTEVPFNLGWTRALNSERLG